MTTDLHITGKVAQFGRGIIGDVSKKLMAQFAANLNTMLDEQPSDAPSRRPRRVRRRRPGADGAPAAPGEAADDPTPAESALGADTPRAEPPAPAEAPKVRKIDSPASEPVELAGVAGPAILKRLRAGGRRPVCSSCSSCAAVAEPTGGVVDHVSADDVDRVRELLGRGPARRVRGRRPRRRRRRRS